MKDYIKFCKEYGFETKNAKSLRIYNNFRQFKQNMAKQINYIKQLTVLDCYKTMR